MAMIQTSGGGSSHWTNCHCASNAGYILSRKRASLLGAAAIELVFDAQRLNNVGKGHPRNVKERKKGVEFAIFVNEFEGGKEMMSTSNHGLFAYEA